MATYPEFKTGLINVWQYLNRNIPYFKKALGIVEEPVGTSGLDPNCFSSCTLMKNNLPSANGIQFDVYKLQGSAVMQDPAAVYIRLLGSVTTSSPRVVVVKNSSNVIAVDSLFGETETAVGTGALVQEDISGDVYPADLMFINRDNNITTPDEHFFYVIGGYTAPFNAIVTVDIEIAVLKGSTFEYSTL